jgi:hypothetical protein
MPTDNPKVSAYVPQAIKDRLTQFREERNISESQAVIIILAEYFEMTEVLGRSSDEIGGVTLAGMQAIEARLTSFVEQVENRLTALEKTTQNKSELLVVQEESSKENQFNDNPLSELPVEPSAETKSQDQNTSEIPLNLLGEPLQEISPIPGIKLSKLRFGRPEAAIAGIKRSKSVEELTEWTRKYDPDGIAWKFVESPMKGYVPIEELSSELKSKLLSWIKENIS